MKKYKAASILMIIHGAFMEIGGCLCVLPLLFMSKDGFNIEQYFSFIVPYFRDNLNLMLIIGMIYGIIRVIGAFGLWKNKLWGLALSVINCVITLALMSFMLPMGIIDGVLAGSALILILIQFFGNKNIIEK